ncbi:MAG: hypothetical protein Q4D79_08325 [Propionibacteriaceae bacterium]|nr:hypothetical protein [Propionibacteriaceae bacterium]
MSEFFAYGETETKYLKARDGTLAEVIDRIGHIHRQVDSDLFSSVVHHIIGQQVSTKAQQTLWRRMNDSLGVVTAENTYRSRNGQNPDFRDDLPKSGIHLELCTKGQKR